MKKNLLLSGILFTIIACNNSNNSGSKGSFGDSAWEAQKQKALSDTAGYTTIQWIDSIFQDMGSVPEGRTVEVAFRFKNNGSKPLIISNVSASCGCTVPETPQQPFAPGQEGTIRAKFNSQGHVGDNNKSVYVNANTKPSTMSELKFHVVVDKAK
jgi:hypothetical protein